MGYELMRLVQLVFALSLMFGAFLAGIGVGWLRWGRRRDEPEPERWVPRPQPAERHEVSRDLFSPEHDDAVDLRSSAFAPAGASASSSRLPAAPAELAAPTEPTGGGA
jgi:hypothetical protein